MKKLLLTTAAVVALSSLNAFATESDFYVKANGGASVVKKIGGFKSKTTGIATIGFGYNIMENLRADLTLDHMFKPTMKRADDALLSRQRLEVKADSLLVNGYVDAYDAGIAKFFVGAGIGAAKVSAKLKSANPLGIVNPTISLKSKTNFSYALHAGASTEFDHDIHGELAYSFKDCGKLKQTNQYVRSHNVTAGIRFDI